MGDDDLRVTLGTKGTGLQQGLLEEDTTLIHVQTSVHIVQRVRDTVNAGEELRIIDVYPESANLKRQQAGDVLSV